MNTHEEDIFDSPLFEEVDDFHSIAYSIARGDFQELVLFCPDRFRGRVGIFTPTVAIVDREGAFDGGI
jgi:hypothetical protein